VLRLSAESLLNAAVEIALQFSQLTALVNTGTQGWPWTHSLLVGKFATDCVSQIEQRFIFTSKAILELEISTIIGFVRVGIELKCRLRKVFQNF